MNKLHSIFLGLGSNQGDRIGNIEKALYKLRPNVKIVQVSPWYETEPWGGVIERKYINLVVKCLTVLPADTLAAYLKNIERENTHQADIICTQKTVDLDILLYDDLVLQTSSLTIPRPQIEKMAYVLVPLSAIAPDLLHPILKKTVRALLQEVDASSVVEIKQPLIQGRDVQQSSPSMPISLDRVGIRGLRHLIHVANGGDPLLVAADIDLFVDLAAEQKGVHMSRFVETVEEGIRKFSNKEIDDVEGITEYMAKLLIERQNAARAEVHLTGEFPIVRTAPLSGLRSQETYKLIGIGAATNHDSVSLVGVQAVGMVACPCAQEMVRDRSRSRLQNLALSDDQIVEILDAVSFATHNQRGVGTLIMSANPMIRAEDMVHLVESSMSSEIVHTLKREDELFVVEQAHRNPKFVEDVVRNMFLSTLTYYVDLPEETFVFAQQENQESIHRHNVFASHATTLGKLRQEVNSFAFPVSRVTMESWINTQLQWNQPSAGAFAVELSQ